MAQKEKVIDFAQQLEMVEQKTGIPVKQQMAVFDAHVQNIGDLIEAHAKAGNKEDLIIKTPITIMNLKFVEESEYIGKDGDTYIGPAHYAMATGVPKYFVELANKDIDLTVVPANAKNAA